MWSDIPISSDLVVETIWTMILLMLGVGFGWLISVVAKKAWRYLYLEYRIWSAKRSVKKAKDTLEVKVSDVEPFSLPEIEPITITAASQDSETSTAA